MEGQLNIRIVDGVLEHPAIDLNTAHPEGFGLSDHSADGPLEGITVYRALDFDKQADLPFRARMTCRVG
jgi:hypothetical protein